MKHSFNGKKNRWKRRHQLHFNHLALDCRLDVSIMRQIHHVGTCNTASTRSSEVHLLARNFRGTVGISLALALLALLLVMVLMPRKVSVQKKKGHFPKTRGFLSVLNVLFFLDSIGFCRIWFLEISQWIKSLGGKCHPNSPTNHKSKQMRSVKMWWGYGSMTLDAIWIDRNIPVYPDNESLAATQALCLSQRVAMFYSLNVQKTRHSNST